MRIRSGGGGAFPSVSRDIQSQFENSSQAMRPPKYGTTVRLDDLAEGIEQIVRLVSIVG